MAEAPTTAPEEETTPAVNAGAVDLNGATAKAVPQHADPRGIGPQFIRHLAGDIILSNDQGSMTEVLKKLFPKDPNDENKIIFNTDTRAAAAEKLVSNLNAINKNPAGLDAESVDKIKGYLTDPSSDSVAKIAAEMRERENAANLLQTLQAGGADFDVQMTRDQLDQLKMMLNAIHPGLGNAIAGMMGVAVGADKTPEQRVAQDSLELGLQGIVSDVALGNHLGLDPESEFLPYLTPAGNDEMREAYFDKGVPEVIEGTYGLERLSGYLNNHMQEGTTKLPSDMAATLQADDIIEFQTGDARLAFQGFVDELDVTNMDHAAFVTASHDFIGEYNAEHSGAIQYEGKSADVVTGRIQQVQLVKDGPVYENSFDALIMPAWEANGTFTFAEGALGDDARAEVKSYIHQQMTGAPLDAKFTANLMEDGFISFETKEDSVEFHDRVMGLDTKILSAEQVSVAVMDIINDMNEDRPEGAVNIGAGMEGLSHESKVGRIYDDARHFVKAPSSQEMVANLNDFVAEQGIGVSIAAQSTYSNANPVTSQTISAAAGATDEARRLQEEAAAQREAATHEVETSPVVKPTVENEVRYGNNPFEVGDVVLDKTLSIYTLEDGGTLELQPVTEDQEMTSKELLAELSEGDPNAEIYVQTVEIGGYNSAYYVFNAKNPLEGVYLDSDAVEVEEMDKQVLDGMYRSGTIGPDEKEPDGPAPNPFDRNREPSVQMNNPNPNNDQPQGPGMTH